MKKTAKKVVVVTSSGGNVFADVGLPRAKGRLFKAQLATKIQQLIEQKVLPHAEAAQFLGLDRSETSNLMRGRTAGFSVERLFCILNRLGRNVEVRISDEEHTPEDTYITVVA